MIHFSFFSGIGGFDLPSEQMGWKNYLSCEINPFCNQVLNYYWPNAYHHTDIKTLDYATIDAELSKRYGRGWRNDDIILTGGFPCQPFSVAGKQRGTEDERHLWPQLLRAIREVKPTYIVGENVFGIINWNEGLVFDQVQTDLEAEGYEVQAFVLPACGVNAPHRRDRVWFIAYSEKYRLEGQRRLGEIGESSQFISSVLINEGIGSQNTKHPDSVRPLNRCEQPITNKKRQYFGRYFESNAKNTTTNSHSNGQQYRGLGEDKPTEGTGKANEQERERIWNNNRGVSEQKSTTDPRKQRLQRCKNYGSPGNVWEKREQQFTRPICSEWENFPTVSPLCQRNDGFSDKLSGIAFSKWRNEGIKAMGNAVVPQVVLQIFKAIEQTRQ